METRKSIRRWLAVPAFAATAAALPLTIGPGGAVELQDACAQTGTCKSSPPDVCVVNGDYLLDREWKSAGG